MMSMILPSAQLAEEEAPENDLSSRVAEALTAGTEAREEIKTREKEEVEFDLDDLGGISMIEIESLKNGSIIIDNIQEHIDPMSLTADALIPPEGRSKYLCTGDSLQ